MAYNIDENVVLGETGHVAHHNDLASAVNDLDERVGGLSIIFVDNLGQVPAGTPVDTLVIVRG